MRGNILEGTDRACSGCGACGAVCPTAAISLKLDKAGFYTAVVDSEACVDCGLCRKVCTRYDSGTVEGISLYDAKLYALQSSDPQRVKSSSSGGLAQELVHRALLRGEKTVGAVYDTAEDRVVHCLADSEPQAEAFSGSKYLQSDPSGVFRRALQEARQAPDARFVVTGTPCQILGMAKAAAHFGVRDQFLLVEIFCHGVPSYRLWERECEKIRKKLNTDHFDSIQFRYKKDDWHSYCLRVTAGKKTFYGARETMLFWQVFFENILLNDSCYRCRARQEISHADIRLGDYWGARFQNRSDGVSAVFACTDKGRAAVEELLREGKVRELPASDAAEMLAAQNMAGYQQQKLHDEAMAVLREQGIDAAVGYYRRHQSGKQKLKRNLLRISALIPAPLRAKLRKRNSSRLLRK